MVKKVLKQLIPPIIYSLLRASTKDDSIAVSNEMWTGNYSSWSEAKSKCTGYDNSNILEKCKEALLKVKNGEAVYERDSVLFGEIQYSWGLLAGIQRAALENDGQLCVLDFGGSLGSSYYQNKEFLSTLKSLKWCIIEQDNFVECGKEYFESEQLMFYNKIEGCTEKQKPNIVLLSGVLQYLENPTEWINKIRALQCPYIILDRISFVETDADLITVQNVPEEIYSASYPAWFFNEAELLKKFKGYYSLASFDSFCDPPKLLNGHQRAKWKGHILTSR